MLSITCSNYSYVTNSLLNRRLQGEVVALLYKIKYHWFLLKDLYREYKLLNYLSPGFPVCANKTNLLILSILLSIIKDMWKFQCLGKKKQASMQWQCTAVLSNHFQTLHSSRSDKSFKSVDSYHLFHDILYIIDTNPKVIRNIHWPCSPRLQEEPQRKNGFDIVLDVISWWNFHRSFWWIGSFQPFNLRPYPSSSGMGMSS